VTNDKVEMETMAQNFLHGLYRADPDVNPQEVLHLFQPCISAGLNLDLCKDFTSEEISDTLFQIGPLKAPGPNGFPACFFQRNWEVMRTDVIKGVQHFFQSGCMPNGVNDTAIVLIPKKNDPEVLKDFRPISLCNVIYKVVSKCLVNRLRAVLHEVIAPTQSAFISRRMITDNALIAFECLHAIKNGNNGCK
jgi:hypothetical protein